MKIRLLNDGGFNGMENVAFPVEVDAICHEKGFCSVLTFELCRVGAEKSYFDLSDRWSFKEGRGHYEVVNDNHTFKSMQLLANLNNKQSALFFGVDVRTIDRWRIESPSAPKAVMMCLESIVSNEAVKVCL